jgi:O-acetylhomoserine/O-acetylserine sulfhydrylase-like pyridoxal-dependent enzyme
MNKELIVDSCHSKGISVAFLNTFGTPHLQHFVQLKKDSIIVNCKYSFIDGSLDALNQAYVEMLSKLKGEKEKAI